MLPIESHLPAVGAALQTAPNVVITAAPGAGKTTRVPRYLLQESTAGEIWVLEPRRLAARWAAEFVARELQEKIGEQVGYRVRFDDATGPRTRLFFVTEGILLRRLLHDPTLAAVRAVVLDEFHGRTVASDVALAILRDLQAHARPDLQIIVMSATLDAAPVAQFLGDCPVLEVPGRQFEVTLEHLPHRDERPLEAQVASAVGRVVTQQGGDILVFLPGMAEIRRASHACAGLAERHQLLLLPLHGGLTPAEQDLAVQKATRRKVILATNVAETSVTIDGVTAVIDSGLARQASFNVWSGMPMLRLTPVSQASAAQRAGRAGRTQPGTCYRLYTRRDWASRPPYDAPELTRLDFTETALMLHSMGYTGARTLAYLDAPTSGAMAAAEVLLERLKAVHDGRLTDIGRAMLRFPVHPRLARLLIDAQARGVSAIACEVVALLADGDMPRRDAPARTSASNDVLVAIAERRGPAPRTAAQLLRLCKTRARPPADPTFDPEQALARAMLAAFPDRVARRLPGARHQTADALLLSGGGRAELAPSSVVRDADYLIAVDVQERIQGGVGKPVVACACAIEADWLLDVEPHGVHERVELVWNGDFERVEAVRGLYYDALLLDESRSTDVDIAAAAAVLAAAVQRAGLSAFVDKAALDGLRMRLALVHRVQPQLDIPSLDGPALDTWVTQLCVGRRSFAELRAANMLGQLEAALPPPVTQALRHALPQSITLANGRRLTVHYEADKPPWVESMLQDFFGQAEGPKLGSTGMPLTLHLLAPNRRPVQVTSDLAGFWQRHYPALKKALSRRYPRHAWPDDPVHAVPPAPRSR